MSLSSLVVPALLAAVAAIGLGRQVDVYGALTRGAEEGLTVLLRIIPGETGKSRIMLIKRLLLKDGCVVIYTNLC